jgi:hypothetical protein
MSAPKWTPGTSPMTREAREAALATFARVVRERHPGVAVFPLTGVGPDWPVVSATAGQVVRPFAAPEDRHALLDQDAGIPALNDVRVD